MSAFSFLVGATADIFTILDGSPALDCSLEELALQRRSGATLIAVVRDGKSVYNFDDDFRLRVNDLLVLLGSHKALDDAGQIFRPARPSDEPE